MPDNDAEEFDVAQFAADMQAGKIVTSSGMPMERVPRVFTAWRLSTDEKRQELLNQGLVVLYEYDHKAGPMEVNGHPVFSHRVDWDSSGIGRLAEGFIQGIG